MRGSIKAVNPNAGKGEPHKQFTFDTVFGPDCKQVDIYNEVARPIVDSVLEGYNGELVYSFYPTALEGCRGIVFTHGVRMGRRVAGKSLSGLYLRNNKV